MKLENLDKVIEELNADSTFSLNGKSETFDSLYKFMYTIKKDSILIYDRNEYFNIDIDEETQKMLKEASKEFGFEYKTPESTKLRILNSLEKALEKDLRKKVEMNWLDPVTLIVYLGD